MKIKLLITSLFLFVMVPTIAEAQKFDRGISMTGGPVFMPKGQIIFGGTISYSDYKFDDYQLAILDNMNASAYTFKVTPNLYYTFAKNMAVGLRFTYKRTFIKLDEIDLKISDDMNFSVTDYYNLQHSYYGSLAFRFYIPLGDSRRFGLFSDIMLEAGAGQGKILNGQGEDMTGTFQNILEAGIDVVPGVIVFMANQVSVEASVGILGLGYKKVTQTRNQIYEGSYESSSANFKINLLSVSLGINFVFNTSKNKPHKPRR